MLGTSRKISVHHYRPFGKTGLCVPPIVFGTSSLGNTVAPIPEPTKMAICSEWFRQIPPPVFIDTGEKYGAGRALEVIGKALNLFDVPRDQVVINIKLGWKRAPRPCVASMPEPGLEANLDHDVEQSINYERILECWEEGCRLLGGKHPPQLASLHDPDQYLLSASSPAERDQRFNDILGALRALGELKGDGLVHGIGIAAKDWRVTKEIDDQVRLDWVMLANSLTVMRHPSDLLRFIEQLAARDVAIINSAIFHTGFLIGERCFDDQVVHPERDDDRRLFAWRKTFVSLCEAYGVAPMHACIQFGLSAPGVVAVALDAAHPDRIGPNVDSVLHKVPLGLWESMKEEGLIAADYPYLG